MKWIRPFLLWVLVFYSSFLFAEGRSMMDTLPGMGSAKQLYSGDENKAATHFIQAGGIDKRHPGIQGGWRGPDLF